MREIASDIGFVSALVGENGSSIAYPGPKGDFTNVEQLAKPFDVSKLGQQVRDIADKFGLNIETHLEMGAERFAGVTGLDIEPARDAVSRQGTVSINVIGGKKRKRCQGADREPRWFHSHRWRHHDIGSPRRS